MSKRFARFFSVLILFIIIFNPLFVNAQVPSITAQSAILIDADSGDVLYSKNANTKLYPASITKIMTALLALEKGNLSDTITMTDTAVFSIERGSSHIALDVGEEITLEQALYALMLVSANDAAAGIAEYIGGSIDNFALMMTKRAYELGATNTNFTNPHGLHNEKHYTTASDMAKIAAEAFKNKTFLQLISTPKMEIPPTNIQEETRYLHNQHKMLSEYSSFYYDGTIGGKTGYTDQAEHTLVTYAQRDNKTLICVIMNADTQQIMYNDTINLFNYGFNQVSKLTLNKSNQIVETVPIYNNLDEAGSEINKLGYVDLITAEEFTFYVDSRVTKKDITTSIKINTPLLAPVYKDEQVGQIVYSHNGTVIGTVPLISGQTFEKIDTALVSSLQQNVTGSTKSKTNVINIIYYSIIILAIFISIILIATIYKILKNR